MKPIDIILPVHNNLSGTGILIPCLRALYQHTSTPFRLIIVDDSEDLTWDWVERERKKHDNIMHIRPETKITKGCQNMLVGLEHVESELAVFMADSTVVNPFWLDVALPVMTETPDIAIMGYKLLYENGLIEHAGIRVDRSGWKDIGRGEVGYYLPVPWIREVQAVGFALVLFRANVVQPVIDAITYEGFNALDDVDTCFEVRKTGKLVVCNWAGSAFHKAGATRLNGIPPVIYCQELMDNWQLFLKKWYFMIPEA